MSDVVIKTQKVIQVGNSYALTLDKKFVDQQGIKPGDELVARYSVRNKIVSFGTPAMTLKDSPHLTPDEQQTYVASQVTPELKAWTDDFLSENQEALEELANL